MPSRATAFCTTRCWPSWRPGSTRPLWTNRHTSDPTRSHSSAPRASTLALFPWVGGGWRMGPRSSAVQRGPKRVARRRPPQSLEVTLGVVREVEVELGDALLEHAPHRLAEVGHEPEQAQVRGVARPRLPEVGAEESRLAVLVELVVHREVREIEE